MGHASGLRTGIERSSRASQPARGSGNRSFIPALGMVLRRVGALIGCGAQVMVRSPNSEQRSSFRQDGRVLPLLTALSLLLGLAGSPAMAETSVEMQVVGLAAGHSLNLRGGPSTNYAVIARLPKGTRVISLGCATSGWCQVYRPEDPAAVGWASGHFLKAAGRPGGGAGHLPAVPPSGGATHLPAVPPTPQSGTLGCRFLLGVVVEKCRYTAVPKGRSGVTVTIRRPDGKTRRIDFDRGAPVGSDGPTPLMSGRNGQMIDVMLGGWLEHYRLPLAVAGGR